MHETTTRNGDWMQTYLGGQFWPLDPRPEDVLIEDIAHALSNNCRYTGHVLHFYSVAEHSVRVADYLRNQGEGDEAVLWGLLHDAPEAYIADVSRPVKRSPGMEAYVQVEDRLMAVIAERFGLPPEMPAAVKEADNVLLMTEARDLMAPPPQKWREWAKPLPAPIFPWSPHVAKAEFLLRFHELTALHPQPQGLAT